MLSCARLSADAGRAGEVVEVLRSIVGPTLAQPGCRACDVWLKADDPESILLLEEWETVADLVRHLRSVLYRRVLSAMEMASAEPEISFVEAAEVHGIEWIAWARSRPAGTSA